MVGEMLPHLLPTWLTLSVSEFDKLGLLHTHTHTHARTHARTHKHTFTHTHTHTTANQMT